jgi:hypothetical protein
MGQDSGIQDNKIKEVSKYEVGEGVERMKDFSHLTDHEKYQIAYYYYSRNRKRANCEPISFIEYKQAFNLEAVGEVLQVMNVEYEDCIFRGVAKTK